MSTPITRVGAELLGLLLDAPSATAADGVVA
jgi:hypothetical protein